MKNVETMKNGEIKPALEAIRKISISSIKDKTVKSYLFGLSLCLLADNRRLTEKIEDIRTVILGPVQESLEEIEKLRFELARATDEAKRKEINEKIESHKEVIEPSVLFNRKVNELLQEDIKVDKIKREDFLAAVSDLEGIDFSVLEGLFPILK